MRRILTLLAAIFVLQQTDLHAEDWIATLQTSGRYMAVQIRDTLVFAASGWGFETFAIHGDGTVERLASIPTVGTTVDLRIDDRYAYVFDEGSGIIIFDCLDPASPVPTATLNGELASANYSFVGDMLLADTILFVAFLNNSQGLYLYNVADRAHPFLFQKHQFSDSPDTLTRPYVLARQDSLLFVVDALGIWVASISDPAQPQRIGYYRSLDGPVTSTSAAVVGNRLVVTDDFVYQSYDVSDLTAPVPTVYQLFRQDVGDWPNQVLAVDSFLLIPVGKYGVKTARVPPDPQDSLELADLFDTPGVAVTLSFEDTLAVIADSRSGVQFVSIGGHASLDSVGYYAAGFLVERVHRIGRYLYARTVGDAAVIDVSNPHVPAVADSVHFTNLWQMQVQGQRLYVSDIDLSLNTTFLEILDLADTLHPVSLRRFEIPTQQGRWFQVRDGYSYHADTRFSILSVADPDSISVLGQVPGAWSDEGNVVLWNGYAYCTYGPRLYIIDISDVTAPDVLNPAGAPYPYACAVAEDSLLYEADGSVLRILSLSDPVNPVPVSEIPLPAAYAMRKHLDRLFVVCGDTVRVIDVTDPLDPRVETVFDTPGSAVGIDLDDSLVYVGDLDGITVLRYETPTAVIDDDWQARPKDFTLSQNIPNPFNAATEIRYQLEAPGEVILRVFNVLGQLVFTHDFGLQAAGAHAAVLADESLAHNGGASGVYFYTLSVNGRQQSRKMLLLK